MNSKFSGILFSATFFFSCNEEIPSSQVPSLVLNVAADKYNSRQVEWEKKGSFYEAEIEINDSIEICLIINAAGTLIMEKMDISKNLVPAKIIYKIGQEFKEYQFNDIEKLIIDTSLYYQFELKSKGKEINLVFNSDGKEEKTIKYWN
jgi:hypothetical protein